MRRYLYLRLVCVLALFVGGATFARASCPTFVMYLCQKGAGTCPCHWESYSEWEECNGSYSFIAGGCCVGCDFNCLNCGGCD